MKITEIKEFDDGVYLITRSPSFLEYLFGARVTSEYFKLLEDTVYTNREFQRVVLDEQGAILPFEHPIVETLNNRRRAKKLHFPPHPKSKDQ